MSATEVGNRPTNPEMLQPPLDPRAVQLHNALTNESTWPDSHQAWRKSFQGIVESAVGATTNPSIQEAIRTVSQEVDWMLYAAPGEPLPAHMILMEDHTGSYKTAKYHPDSPVDHNVTHRVIRDYLLPHGLKTRLEAHAADRAYRTDYIINTMSNIVRSTNNYQLLAGFGVDLPQDAQEQPLTTYWRQVRERQAEAHIRNQYALADGQPIPPNSQADHALRRAIQHLDNETMPLPKQHASQQDGFSRARAYFGKQMCGEGEEIIWPEARPGKHIQALINKADGSTWEVGEAIWGGLSLEEDEAMGGFAMPSTFNEDFAKYFICLLFTVGGVPEGADYNEFLEAFLQDYLINYLPRNGELDLDASELEWEADTMGSGAAWRKQPVGAVHPHEIDSPDAGVIHQLLHEETKNQAVTSHDRWRYEREQAKTIGTVREHLSQFAPPVVDRLIQTQKRQELPPIDRNRKDQIIISFEPGYFDDGTMPHIPGYQVDGASSFFDTFSFSRNTESDPYQVCQVEIDDYNVDHLAKTYTKMGLVGLADSLANGEVSTVDDLTRAIAKHSVYTFEWKHSHTPEKLEDFGQLIEEGKLHIQCTGAANFLRMSLQQAFGTYSNVNTASGYVLPADGSRIDGIKHLQTVFTHEGKQYILDATPAMSQPGWLARQQGTGYAHERRVSDDHKAEEPAKAPQPAKRLPLFEAIELDVLDEVEVTAKYQEASLGSILASLKSQLQIIFEQPSDQALYKAVLLLPEHDPVRRTLSAAMQSERQTLDHAGVEELIQYLQKYANTTPARLRELHFKVYDAVLLDSLIATAQKLGTMTQASR